MITTQSLSLMAMLAVGGMSTGLLVGWDHMSRRKQFFIVAWLVFWFGPPLYFIWTKGVLG